MARLLGSFAAPRAGFLAPPARRPPCSVRSQTGQALPFGIAGIAPWRAGLEWRDWLGRTSSASGRFPCATSTSPTLHVADRQIPLPAGVARIGFGEAVQDFARAFEVFERSAKIALCDLNVANLGVADRQIALPLGIRWDRRARRLPQSRVPESYIFRAAGKSPWAWRYVAKTEQRPIAKARGSLLAFAARSPCS